MDRLERVRVVVDDVLAKQPDLQERRCGFVHLYGVAYTCALLALKRGLDPQVCITAGMLHDIWSYKTADPTDHARLSADEARELLGEVGEFSDSEISLVCEAISSHSSKGEVHGALSELLKDADVLAGYLYNASPTVHESRVQRLGSILAELGIAKAEFEQSKG